MGEFAVNNRNIIIVVVGIESEDVFEQKYGELKGRYERVRGDPLE